METSRCHGMPWSNQRPLFEMEISFTSEFSTEFSACSKIIPAGSRGTFTVPSRSGCSCPDGDHDPKKSPVIKRIGEIL